MDLKQGFRHLISFSALMGSDAAFSEHVTDYHEEPPMLEISFAFLFPPLSSVCLSKPNITGETHFQLALVKREVIEEGGIETMHHRFPFYLLHPQ